MIVKIYDSPNTNYPLRIVCADLPSPRATFSDINFIQGNGVDTTLTLNVDSEVSWRYPPNYLSVEEERTGYTWIQYWWVMSSFFERSGQLTLTLHRDFIREYWSSLSSDSIFLIKKASQIPDSVADAQYKKTMNLSQVKTKEILLGEYYTTIGSLNILTGQGWLVGYVSKERELDSGGTEPVLKGKTFSNTTICPYTVTFPSSSWTGTPTSAYDIFAIPVLGSFTVETSDGSIFTSNMSLEICKEIATMLSVELGSNLYDLQYLPYVTFSMTDKTIVQAGYSAGIVTDGSGTQIGAIPVMTSDTRSFQLPNQDNDLIDLREEFNAVTSNLDRRKWNEKHLIRLVSPNFASQFEFSPVNNGTQFPNFMVSIGLRPYNPFIYVYPIFNGLYGQVFNDGRGLIFAGDLSLDQVSNAWTEYQLQNKNYQLSFQREIQSLDLKQSYEAQLAQQARDKSIFKTIGATASGAVGGVLAGGRVGGSAGAIVGGLTGSATSLASGIYNAYTTFQNTAMEAEIRADTRQASIDQFQYQIGNVQASPNTLTKVSAVNPNFKVFPVLEIYECTKQESSNLDLAIRYSGVEINMVDLLENYTSGFVQGTLLSSADLYLPADQIAEIQKEFETGVYIKEVYNG